MSRGSGSCFLSYFWGWTSFLFLLCTKPLLLAHMEQVLGCGYLPISSEPEWCFHGLFAGLSAEWFCIQWENNTLALNQWSVVHHICLDNGFEMDFEALAGAHQKRKLWLMSKICYGQGRANCATFACQKMSSPYTGTPEEEIGLVA